MLPQYRSEPQHITELRAAHFEIYRLQEELRQQVLQTSYWRDHYEAACGREQALARESIRLLNHGVPMKEGS